MTLPALHLLAIGVSTMEGGKRRRDEAVAAEMCDICHDPLGDVANWSTLCINGHAFHIACIETYLRSHLGATCPTGHCRFTASWEARRATLLAAGNVEMGEENSDDDDDDDDDEEEEDEDEDEDEGLYTACQPCGDDFAEMDGPGSGHQSCAACNEPVCDNCVVRCDNCGDDVYCADCANDELVGEWCPDCRGV